jgi:hypothetical protein
MVAKSDSLLKGIPVFTRLTDNAKALADELDIGHLFDSLS